MLRKIHYPCRVIVYNVTVKVDLNVHDLWLRWMREEHIPRVMETGCFVGNKMYRLLEEDTRDGITYVIQYFAEDISRYFDYKEHHAARLQKEGLEMFPGKFQAFRSLLREV
ncbi:MAG: DUF4286 family protein [Chitinophagales bacterium]|nr:DUF4286 family protein [Chitinophagales bacterium]MDW8418304.1 DUF4286 family protein [Chitinophagales bacterium]